MLDFTPFSPPAHAVFQGAGPLLGRECDSAGIPSREALEPVVGGSGSTRGTVQVNGLKGRMSAKWRRLARRASFSLRPGWRPPS